MANNYPWYKFDAAEWLTGEIVMESFAVQGLFTNVCALYWQRSGNLTIADIKKRYKNPVELSELEGRFFEVGENGCIIIKFLSEQLSEKHDLSKTRSESGSKGGLMKARNAAKNGTVPPPDTPPPADPVKRFVPPVAEEVVGYFLENGYTAESGQKAWKYYETGKWKDSKGNPVKNWKQKMQSVWFKPENKKANGVVSPPDAIYKNEKGQDVFPTGKRVNTSTNLKK